MRNKEIHVSKFEIYTTQSIHGLYFVVGQLHGNYISHFTIFEVSRAKLIILDS